MARFRSFSEHGDARFARDSHDVRNWSVRTRVDDVSVGRVHDVLLDEAGRTRYLDLELDGGRHVLMPSGDARIDPADQVVHVSGLDRAGLRGLPEYDRSPESITPEYARSLTTAYDDAYSPEHHHHRPDYTARWDRGTGRRAPAEVGRVDRLDDIEVASGEHDPRGWDVVGADGHRVGEVDHLIGDTGAMKVRYLTVKLDEEIDAERPKVLLPVGHVDLDDDRHRVITRALDRERATAMPAYEGGAIDRAYETDLTRRYAEAYRGDRHYEHPRYRADALDTEQARARRAERERAVGAPGRAEVGPTDATRRR